MRFNINDKVNIKLTPLGASILKSKNEVAYKYSFDIAKNILNEQLWVVMNIFGDELYNGSHQLFIDNIIEL
uniref:Uncharacterized protein n=1 Tax=viral metagenome TaxID=1070528 RepID=A0A6M3KZX5_9ZZZZ